MGGEAGGTAALAGMRVLVVGASSGIGRAIGLAAAERGARVAFAARRTDLLAGAAAEAVEQRRSEERRRPRPPTGDAVAVTCDVRDERSVTTAVEEAAGALGGLDAVVYATGTSPLRKLADADAALWRLVLETNVAGAALVLRGALEHLRRSDRPHAVVLSSHSVEDPWPGLIPYVVSKTALDAFVRGWRVEITDVPLTRVVVGPTLTGFADGWDPELAGEMFERWAHEGLLPDEPAVMEPDEVAAEVLRVLTSPVALTDVRVLPR